MATNTSTGTPANSTTDNTNSTTDETQGQEQQGQQQSTEETSGQEQQQTSNTPVDKDTKLPDDHPLVKTLAANKTRIAELNNELTEARAKASKATQLETDLAARPTTEAVATLQNRTHRLEAFLQAVGGPLAKALDSKSFTTALFETDKDIKDIVKEFNAANPTATSTALGAAAAAPAKTGPSINDLLRAGAK